MESKVIIKLDTRLKTDFQKKAKKFGYSMKAVTVSLWKYFLDLDDKEAASFLNDIEILKAENEIKEEEKRIALLKREKRLREVFPYGEKGITFALAKEWISGKYHPDRLEIYAAYGLKYRAFEHGELNLDQFQHFVVEFEKWLNQSSWEGLLTGEIGTIDGAGTKFRELGFSNIEIREYLLPLEYPEEIKE